VHARRRSSMGLTIVEVRGLGRRWRRMPADRGSL
jgi:hypothetical protein